MIFYPQFHRSILPYLPGILSGNIFVGLGRAYSGILFWGRILSGGGFPRVHLSRAYTVMRKFGVTPL